MLWLEVEPGAEPGGNKQTGPGEPATGGASLSADVSPRKPAVPADPDPVPCSALPRGPLRTPPGSSWGWAGVTGSLNSSRKQNQKQGLGANLRLGLAPHSAATSLQGV